MEVEIKKKIKIIMGSLAKKPGDFNFLIFKVTASFLNFNLLLELKSNMIIQVFYPMEFLDVFLNLSKDHIKFNYFF